MKETSKISRFALLVFILGLNAGASYSQKSNSGVSKYAPFIVHELNETDRKFYLQRYFKDLGSVVVYKIDKIERTKSKSDTIFLSGVLKIKDTSKSLFSSEELKKIAGTSFSKTSTYGFKGSLFVFPGDTNLCDFSLDAPGHSIDTSRDAYENSIHSLDLYWQASEVTNNIKKIKTKFAKADQITKDKLFGIVLKNMREIASSYNNEGYPNEPKYHKELGKLAKHGFKIGNMGFELYLYIDYKYLSKNFKGFISLGAQNFLDTYIKEQESPSEAEEPYRKLLPAAKALDRLILLENSLLMIEDEFLRSEVESLLYGYFMYFVRPIDESLNPMIAYNPVNVPIVYPDGKLAVVYAFLKSSASFPSR